MAGGSDSTTQCGSAAIDCVSRVEPQRETWKMKADGAIASHAHNATRRKPGELAW